MRRPSTLLTGVAVLGVLTAGAWTAHNPESNSHRNGSHRNGTVNQISRTGTITGWSITDDGTVSIRLEGQHDNREFKLWFSTPASRTATTRFENLILEAVLALGRTQGATTVTVGSETSNNESGGRLTDALPLRRLQKN